MYTRRLRTLVSLDILLIMSLPLLRASYAAVGLGGKVPYLAVCTAICALWVIARLIISAEYQMFNNIWYMFPSRMVTGGILAVLSVIFGLSLEMDYNSIGNCMFMMLLGYQDFKADKYALKQARIFKMDQLESLDDLVEKYPPAFLMLSKSARKQLKTGTNS